MKAVIRDKQVLLTVGIGLILFGVIYAINGLTQGVVIVPVRLTEGAGVTGPAEGMFTHSALIDIWDVTFVESLAHRNVSTGMLALLLGCALVVRTRELSKNPLNGWHGSALLLMAAGIVPIGYALTSYSNLLAARGIDLTATSEPISDAGVFAIVGLVLFLGRNKHLQRPALPQVPQRAHGA